MAAADQPKSQGNLGLLAGGLLGLLGGIFQNLASSEPSLLLAAVLLPLWTVVGIGAGGIVQRFLQVRARSTVKVWEEGARKIIRIKEERGEGMKNPFVIGNLIALLLTGGALMLLGALMALVYLPVLLK